MTTYADPAAGGGDKLPLKDVLGSLLLIDVIAQENDVQTSFGPANPIRANVAVLDGGLKGERFDDTLIFPRVLISQLRPNVGAKVLARLGQLPAKPGQSPAWTLQPATDADRSVAEKYEAYVATQAAAQNDAF